MGEFPARIVAQDFVTPPELSAFQLAHEGSGRIGGGRVTLGARGGATHIVARYEQIPIRVAPLQLGPTEPALVYLINPTAGLLDGDAHLFEIHAGPGTHAVVTGQSASRLHPCSKGFCTQQWKVSVADGAVLVVLPGPAIPFAGTRYFQRVEVELGQDARFIWGDIWFAGRYARAEASERFQFESLVQEMVIHRQRQLVFRDRFVWRGPWSDHTAEFHFAGQPAAGSIFSTVNVADELPAKSEHVRSAALPTSAGDTCCRFVGTSSDVVRQVVHSCLALASHSVREPWLLEKHHLAKVHWFDA